jgi:MFS family permease
MARQLSHVDITACFILNLQVMEHLELKDCTNRSVQQPHSSWTTVHAPNSTPSQLTLYQEQASSSQEVRDADTYCPRTTSWWLFIVIGSLYLGTFLVALDTTIIGTAIPAITTQFHALDEIAWYGNGYLLTLTALQPIFGKLYKVVDTKILYLISIGVFERKCSHSYITLFDLLDCISFVAVGSITCATAPSSSIFIASRGVAGCGAAGLMQGSFAIVVKLVPLAKRPFYFGLFVSAFGVSIGIGPMLGGFFADRGIWPWCFWMCVYDSSQKWLRFLTKYSNVPLGAIVAFLVVIFFKLKSIDKANDQPRRGAKQMFYQLDLAGSVLVIASVCCLLLAMQWGGRSLRWTSLKIISLFVLSGILLSLFLFVEWKMGDDAAVPFSVLRQRSIAFGTMYLFLSSMPNFSVSNIPIGTKIKLIATVRYLHTHLLPSSKRLRRAEKWDRNTLSSTYTDLGRRDNRSVGLQIRVLCM